MALITISVEQEFAKESNSFCMAPKTLESKQTSDRTYAKIILHNVGVQKAL